MSRFYRYRLPSWCRQVIYVFEIACLPILIYQLFRTLFFPTSLDVFLLGIWIGIWLAFKYKWI
ncbi:hypothetical protein [Halobacillus massiliensis]|uniref:hypothetical protein n=1 Tax=Halobacillus massiliensis TaxID=1926286 RepID=UPI0009E634CE|nr:hypothetical protein [Halobacillus massiliensis]